ncbi:MAG: response regulator transcription factor [Oscillospiraceae bacterium]|jgi:DNA-binding response OmpR family regulator|nr:response regulator transcription factor [Oscillospiraceae bacterium]
MAVSQTILICDDDPIVHQSLSLYLDAEGFQHRSAHTGPQALTAATSAPEPDLILLDIMMPEMSGMDVCRALRKVSQIPVIMLTARGEEFDRVIGLELGADDYIVKPFSPREVISRIKAVLRRAIGTTKEESGRALKYGALDIDPDSYTVRVNNAVVAMTPREVELLALLASHPGRVYPRETILSQVWGYDYYGDSRTVDTHIKRLRQKLSFPGAAWQITTVYGVGYKFEADAG